MKAETKLFPYGGIEGHPVLRLDCEGEAWSDAAAAAAFAQARPPGLFGLWIDNMPNWLDPAFTRWMTTKPGAEDLEAVALRELGARDVLSYGVAYVLDATEAFRQSKNVDELADYLAQRAHVIPEAQDLVVRIGADQSAPTSGMLDALANFVQPSCTSYLYAPRDHRHWPLLERAASQCSSLWALRGSV